MTLAIVGDVDPARVRAKVHALFAVRRDGERLPPPEVPVEPPRPAGGPEQVFKFLNKQQAHIVVGFPGTTIAHPDRFALEVLATILSGQGGRLFVELRDRRALAYRISAFSLEGVDPGYFAVYLATSPQNLDEAVAGIRAELARVVEQPIARAELERAKRYLVGAHEISLQRRAALASSLAFHEAYGLGYGEYRRYAPGILAVTAQDVQRVARAHLDWGRAVVAVVKPEEATPKAARRPRVAQGTPRTTTAPAAGRGAHARRPGSTARAGDPPRPGLE
jgi:zinc protease